MHLSLHDCESLHVEKSHKDGHVWTNLFIKGRESTQISLHHTGPLHISPDREPLLWLAAFDIDLAHRISAIPSYHEVPLATLTELWEQDYYERLELLEAAD